MKFHAKGWAVMAAVALVASAASTALAIESFQERFEWGDMSKPTTLQGRVIVLDPYDEAVWINVSVFGGSAESGYFWQKMQPGKNLKFYADKGAWEELKKMGRPHAGPAAAKEVAHAPHRLSPSYRGSPASRFRSWRRRWASSRTTCTACCPVWNRKGRSTSGAAAGTPRRKPASASAAGQGAVLTPRPSCS